MSVDYALKLRFSVGTIKRVLVCFWQPYYSSYYRISEILERDDSNHTQICVIQSNKAFLLKNSHFKNKFLKTVAAI